MSTENAETWHVAAHNGLWTPVLGAKMPRHSELLEECLRVIHKGEGGEYEEYAVGAMDAVPLAKRLNALEAKAAALETGRDDALQALGAADQEIQQLQIALDAALAERDNYERLGRTDRAELRMIRALVGAHEFNLKAKVEELQTALDVALKALREIRNWPMIGDTTTRLVDIRAYADAAIAQAEKAQGKAQA